MEKLLGLLGVGVLMVASIFYELFVQTKVWGYIAVKMFNLPAISLWQAFAIGSLIGIFVVNFNKKAEKTEDLKDAATKIGTKVLGYTLAWGLLYWIFG